MENRCIWRAATFFPAAAMPGRRRRCGHDSDCLPGAWRVEALAIDDAGKACRADWRAEVKADPTPVATKPQQRLRRLTVFVDSQPIRITPGLFPPSDLAMLTGSLAALLRFIPAQSARLVIFNMSQQKESFRSDSFQPAALPEVGKTIEGNAERNDRLRESSAAVDRGVRGRFSESGSSRTRPGGCGGVSWSRWTGAIQGSARDDCHERLTSGFLVPSTRPAANFGRAAHSGIHAATRVYHRDAGLPRSRNRRTVYGGTCGARARSVASVFLRHSLATRSATR